MKTNMKNTLIILLLFGSGMLSAQNKAMLNTSDSSDASNSDNSGYRPYRHVTIIPGKSKAERDSIATANDKNNSGSSTASAPSGSSTYDNDKNNSASPNATSTSTNSISETTNKESGHGCRGLLGLIGLLGLGGLIKRDSNKA